MNRLAVLKIRGSMRIGAAVLVAVVLALAAAVPGAAQTDEEERIPVEPFLPETIGDLGAYSGSEASELAAMVTEISYNDLVTLGVKNVAEALAMVSGLYVSSPILDPELQESYASVRGQRPNAAKVLIDGIPIASTDYNAVDLAQLPVDNIVKIRIIRGAASALYGADTSGGVINLITRLSPGKLSANFYSSYGTADAFEYRMGIGSTLRWFNLYISGSHLEADGFNISETYEGTRNEKGHLRDSSAYRKDNYAAKFGFRLGDAGEVKVSGAYYESKREIPTEQVIPDPDYLGYPTWRRWNAGLFANLTPIRHFGLNVKGFWNSLDNKLLQYQDLQREIELEERLWQKTLYGADVQAFIDFKPWSLLKLRAMYMRDDVGVHLQNMDWEHFQSARHSYDAEWETHPIKQLWAVAGISAEVFEGLLSDRGATADDVFTTDPMAGITYAPIDRLTLSLSYARKRRFPSLRELYIGEGANKDQVTEMSNIAEFIARLNLGLWGHIHLAAFRQDVLYQIVSVMEDDQGLGFHLENVGEQEFWGGEMQLEITPVNELLFRGGYAYLAPEENYEEAQTDKVYYVPSHRATLLARYRFPFGLGAAFWMEYTSERYFRKDDAEDYLEYHLLYNARVFFDYRDSLELFVYATNLADLYYEKTRYYGEPGRMIFGGMQVQF